MEYDQETQVLNFVSGLLLGAVRFSRNMELVGLLLNAAISAFMGRYVFAGFARDHAIAVGTSWVLADAYVSLMQLGGMTMLLAIRAALIPSRPRRTLMITALFGVPPMLVNSLFVPGADGVFSLRGLDSVAFPWMPANQVIPSARARGVQGPAWDDAPAHRGQAAAQRPRGRAQPAPL